MTKKSRRTIPPAIAIVGGCIVASTLVSTAIATTAAVAVAAHRHAEPTAEVAPPPSCALDILEPVLKQAVAADIRLVDDDDLDDVRMDEAIAWYRWYVDRRELIEAGGCDAYVDKRLASLLELQADLAEMRRLEALAIEVEAAQTQARAQ